MYSHTNGVATSNESNRSKNPPCPGIKLPLSLISANRLSLLSSRSPQVPKMAHIAAIHNQCCQLMDAAAGIKLPAKAITIIHSNAPPIVPSQVFLGDILEKGVLPMNDPTKYAMVSFIQMENIIPQGSKGEYRIAVLPGATVFTFNVMPRSIIINSGIMI